MDDSLFPLLLILRYMHILGAIALMGGAIFMRFALLPSAAELTDGTRKELHEKVRARWSKLVMISAALLLISGIANLGLAARYEFGGFVSYNMLGGIKLLLALPIFFFASLLAGRTATAQKFQANAKLWMNVNLALALVMVLLGGLMRFIPRDLKTADETTVRAAARAELDLPSSRAAK
jgi:uncharacterized membrane protein